ncbi:hypothetical protein AGMMS49525_04560 [Bacteroidia bacterium]|nr:hypothetical protein AGMMS49525_04560 [Bacteroidia bacterium]
MLVIMDFIKDKKQLFELTSELIYNCGSGKEIAKVLDDLLFNYLRFLCNENECICSAHQEAFYITKELRDLFFQLETN